MKFIQSKGNGAVLDSDPATPTKSGLVYCPMCTHSVRANVEPAKRGHRAVANQRCPRCGGAMDASIVIRVDAN